MFRKYRVLSAVACLLVMLSIMFLSSTAQGPGGIVPSKTLNLGGTKVNGFVSTSDGQYVFTSLSVGRESSVFIAAANSTTLEFYGKRVRGCPTPGEICLVQIRGNINPQDLEYNEAKKVLFVPGYDDDTLYISQVVFKDGKPTEAKAAKKVAVGAGPRAVAVNAEGTRAFTVNEREHTVSVVDILYKDNAPDKGEVIATIRLDPNEENPTYPSPADIILKGDKAYVVNTDTWKVCEINNINAPTQLVRTGQAQITLGACTDTGAHPRAIATIGDTAYVVNSTGDSVSQLLLAPQLTTVAEVEVGDAPRRITTDNKCWVVVTNTGVDRGGASVTLLSKDLKWSLTIPLEAATPGDPIVPTQVQLVPKGDAMGLWILNIGVRGELNIYFYIGPCRP